MQTYLFNGIVLPERAQLSIQLSVQFTHIASGKSGKADVSVVLNQVAVWVDTEAEWDIFDLRNTVRNLLQNELAVIGYLEGHVYDLEVTRVLNRTLGVDYVFGIDIPCIANRNKSINKLERLALIRQKSSGREGVLLHLCFNDLAMAMKSPEGTGFYCYRAIESLRQHCIVKFSFPPDKKSEHWQKLREISGCNEETIREIKSAADPVRHGAITLITSQDREALFTKTWNIVDGYIQNI